MFVKGNGSFDVPDRLTGVQAVEVRQNYFIEKINLFHSQELNQILPGRGFELTCVNVSKEELAQQRIERIQHLLYPLDTVLDDSIGCAIWLVHAYAEAEKDRQ